MVPRLCVVHVNQIIACVLISRFSASSGRIVLVISWHPHVLFVPCIAIGCPNVQPNSLFAYFTMVQWKCWELRKCWELV